MAKYPDFPAFLLFERNARKSGFSHWCARVVMRLPLMYIPRTDPSEQESEGGRMFYHEV